MLGCSRRARIWRSARKRWRDLGVFETAAEDLDRDLRARTGRRRAARGRRCPCRRGRARAAAGRDRARRRRAGGRAAVRPRHARRPGRSRKVAPRASAASSRSTSARSSGVAARTPRRGRPRARPGGMLERRGEQRVDLAPALSAPCIAPRSSSSLDSQALARRHSRPTVSAEMPSTRGGLLEGQAAEEAQLDDRGLARVELASRSPSASSSASRSGLLGSAESRPSPSASLVPLALPA